jgi:hypothetical protein
VKFNYDNWLAKLGHENENIGMYSTNFTKTYELKTKSLDLRFVKFNYDNWLAKLGHENENIGMYPTNFTKTYELKKN